MSGEVYIGGGETRAMQLLAQVARGLQKENPQIRYHLYSGNGDDVSERRDKGLLVVWKKYQVFSRGAETFLQRMQAEFPANRFFT